VQLDLLERLVQQVPRELLASTVQPV